MKRVLIYIEDKHSSRLKAEAIYHALTHLEVEVQVTTKGSRERPDLIITPDETLLPTVGRWNDELGLPGPTEEQAKTLIDKFSLYDRTGLTRRFSIWIPKSIDDLLAAQWPVILKPRRGSGAWQECPWSYRAFPDGRAAMDYLQFEGLAAQFLHEQERGIEHFVMPFFERPKLLGNHVVMDNYGMPCIFLTTHCVIEDLEAVENYGPVPFDTHERAEVLGFINTLSDYGVAGMLFGLEFASTDKGIIPFDLNPRIGNIWTSVGNYLRPEIMIQHYARVLGVDIIKDIPRATATCYAKRPLCMYLQAGRRLGPHTVPENDETALLTRRDWLRDGWVIPNKISTGGPYPQIFGLAHSVEQARWNARAFAARSSFSYR